MKSLHLLRPLSYLLLASLGPMVTSCDQHPPAEVAESAAADEVAALEKVKARLERELKETRAATEKGQAEVLQKNEQLQRENDELKAQFEKAQDEAARTRKEFDDFKTKHKLSVRSKLKGQAVPRIEAADNAAYESVVIREVTSAEISFTHAGGVARLPLASLPKSLQEQVLFDPKEQEAEEAARKAAEEATTTAAALPDISLKDPNHLVNPVVVTNLRNRIVARQTQIADAQAEIVKVKNSGYAGTNMGTYRLNVLARRIAQLNDDIRALTAMLNGELNG